jgi:hypothetical protein
MSSGYFYKNININNLVAPGSTTVPGYIGFPSSFLPSCNDTGFDKPTLFLYSYQGTDVSNSTTATYNVTNNANNDGYSGTIPLAIPGTSIKYNYVSICCSGGGGGGGGGGNGTNLAEGGDGAPGTSGSYAAVLDCPVSSISAINFSIGSGGTSGNANNGVGAGAPGNKGGDTSVSLGIIGSINCEGGFRGNGGGPTPGSAKGSNGNKTATSASNIGFSNYTSAITTVNAPTYTPLNYPPQNQSFSPDKGKGAFGDGGAGNTGGNSSGGKPGNAGFVLVYLSV